METGATIGELQYRQAEAVVMSQTGDISGRDQAWNTMVALASESVVNWERLIQTMKDRAEDIRQSVLERCLEKCPRDISLKFTGPAVEYWLEKIDRVSGNQKTVTMHLILICLASIGSENRAIQVIATLLKKSKGSLPPSVRARIVKMGMSNIVINHEPERPLEGGAVELALRTARRTGADPMTVDEALETGWRIVRQSGSQYILEKEGKRITRHQRK